ncbi:hypothetical protein [Pleionea sediminis]|uniref:hypothetical protein n=1 Tax=Pleionea sediminis TaxID=2569479 RepID=UPI0011864663|nr:hypothetical protein [Pleionea sediminis]
MNLFLWLFLLITDPESDQQAVIDECQSQESSCEVYRLEGGSNGDRPPDGPVGDKEEHDSSEG